MGFQRRIGPVILVVSVVAFCLLGGLPLLGCGGTSTTTTVSSSTTTTSIASSTSSVVSNPSTTSVTSAGSGEYVLLAWNDLGMHCYNPDFKTIGVLPPYNNLWAQVVKRGDKPQLVTQGITIEYRFPENTYSAGMPGKPDKTNFWQYAQKMFGLAQPLPVNVGLKGKGLSGTLDLVGDHFVAEGIPLTEYRDQDAASLTSYPFQKAEITVKDASGAILAQQTVVAPVSTEMHCDTCHSDSGSATKQSGITPSGDVYTNIVLIHDKRNAGEYAETGMNIKSLLDISPVLCATCHKDNALGMPGVGEAPSLSNAIHRRHSNVGLPAGIAGCESCHPGPNTQCLRDVHRQTLGYECTNCHGDISNVAKNTDPWLSEPRCDNTSCHKVTVPQTQALYKLSTGMGGIYCEGCHDSTHALAKSREANDQIKFLALQNDAGPLGKCSVCHTTAPEGTMVHK